MQLDPDLLDQPSLLATRHLLMSQARAHKLLRQCLKQLEHRLGAAHVLLPFFRRAELIAAGSAPMHRQRPTVDDTILHTLEQEEARQERGATLGVAVPQRFERSAGNFETRNLRASLPVAHIAMAAAMVIQQSQDLFQQRPELVREEMLRSLDGPQVDVGDFLINRFIGEAVVARALALEALLPHLERPRIPPGRIVRLCLAA